MRPNALTFFSANSESNSERFGFCRRGHAAGALCSLGVACAVTVTLPVCPVDEGPALALMLLEFPNQ